MKNNIQTVRADVKISNVVVTIAKLWVEIILSEYNKRKLKISK
jgi:hypothetical protein